jgi:hypothetical protein
MTGGPVFARVHVLVLCDHIERRPGEPGVFDLRGVRTGVRATSFPYAHPLLCAYLQVSGHEGTASGHLVAVRAETEEAIVNVPIDEFDLLGPLNLISFWLQLHRCEFPAPGVYWFQVHLNDKLVPERRFQVELSENPNGQAGA